jgi:UDP-GlcNAc:undecaprenyl-phosphate GlcNAc-1-phosphate transferase
MFSLGLLAFSSFVLSLLLTPAVRNLAIRLGWVDHPAQHRKLHCDPVPRVGGVAIGLAYVISFVILLLSPLQGGDLVEQALPLFWKLLPAALLIFATGLLDDLVGLRPWQKLAGQLVASGLACWAGVQIQGVGGYSFQSWWSVPVTLLWLIGCTNAFNLIDGVDGLAAGVGLFATMTMLIAALYHGHYALALVTAPLAGSLLGFLRFNFNPASIFLGDCGSLWIGFLLGCYGVLWSQKSATVMGMTAPLMALSIPLFDTGLAIIRRLLRGQPLFGADRGHIHHRLLDRGLTPRRVAVVLYGFCGLAAAFSLLQSMVRFQYGGLVILLFCAAAWIGIQHLGYVELSTTGRLIFPGAFLRVLNAQLRLRTLEDSLTAAASVKGCWRAIRDVSREFGFNHVRLRFGQAAYEERFNGAAPGTTWTVRIPLSGSEYLNLSRSFDGAAEPMIVAPLVDVLQRSLQAARVRIEGSSANG